MHILSIIHWNPSDVALSLGSFGIRWYSLCWLFGLLGAYFVVRWLYRHQKIEKSKFEPLFIYCFLGILIGARLGHCLFYEPDVYLSSWTKFIEIFIPMQKTAEGWKFTGYEGLASHGGTIGIITALWLYCRHTKLKAWTVMDNIGIATPLTACCIRLGNLMNSEIIGNPTDMPWAFVFERVDMLPRHPGQLYEALCYLVFFFISVVIYRRHSERVGTGYFFGLCLTLIFTARFFIEFTKREQVDFENGMLLNMGQLLSIPFIIIGVWALVKGRKRAMSGIEHPKH